MASTTVPAEGGKTSVAADNTQSVTLLEANPSRKDASIWNNSTAYLYVDMTGGTASSTSATFKMYPDEFYEFPRMEHGVYQGKVTGRWSANNGNAQITEYTQ